MNLKTPIVKPIDYINTDNVFFTSDFHVGHANVIKFDKRPFTGVNEMSEEIIKRWNSVVKKDSIVYYMGDLSYKTKSNYTKWFVNQLNGEIRVILGNHDRINDLVKLDRFSDIQTYKRIDFNVNGDKDTLILSHYPMLTWDKSFHGSIHLHGHCHQNLKNNKTDTSIEYYKGKVIDVSCNGWDYTPISYTQIKEIMKNKGINRLDMVD